MESKRIRTQRIAIVADSDDDFEFDSDGDPEFMPESEEKVKLSKLTKTIKMVTTKQRVKNKPIRNVKNEALESPETEVRKPSRGTKRKRLNDESISKKKRNTIETESSDAVPNKSYSCLWTDDEVISENIDVPTNIVKNVINLLNQDCTIPFIARYRKELTGCLSPEKLRDVQASYEQLKLVHKKVENILKSNTDQKFDDSVAKSLLNAKTLSEIDLLYAPYKPGSKKTLAERSRQNGLEPISLRILRGEAFLSETDLSPFVNPNEKGMENENNVLKGIQHIIADVFSKDQKVLDFLRHDTQLRKLRVTSSKTVNADKEDRKAFVEGKTTQNFKYENYFGLDVLVNNIRSHQVLALNRGESQKVLKVKILVPSDVKTKILKFIWDNFFHGKSISPETASFLKICVDDAYERLIEPHFCRQIRTELTKKAEKESIDVFCSNLKTLLLTAPVRGKTVLGIDPGFSHGCKLAVVSPTGEVLSTDVIYPHKMNKTSCKADVEKFIDLVLTYKTDIIAIGNGTACRETETWLSNLINCKCFEPVEVKYCIVSESGASIYSVTKVAEQELPNMDPNMRSAVTIARRLQDPLLEYVKVEPKHIGVGMYQHDVSETQLKKALDGVVVECVSFVGVDLNVCPEFLLKKISGLNSLKARQIVEWREKNGSFINRLQLRDVKGLGPKSFEQCAGFVRIVPQTSIAATTSVSTASSVKRKKNEVFMHPNPFDTTIIHPESYDLAERILCEFKGDLSQIGHQALVDKVNNYIKFTSVEYLAGKYEASVPSIQLIIDAFKQLQEYDIRGLEEPLFLTSVRTVADLRVSQELTGCVRNVTHFGAFVDIGVGKCGLIHVSKMRGLTVHLGDKVLVQIKGIHVEKGKIELELKKKI